MEKKQYIKMKELNEKVKNGTANYHERNIFKIIQKKKDKKIPIYFK